MQSSSIQCNLTLHVHENVKNNPMSVTVYELNTAWHNR
jgi:hypothetical protein